MYHIMLVALSLIISGCAKKEVKQPVKEVVHKKISFNESDIQRQEAALLDIAIPTYQKRLPIFCEDQYTGQVVLGYQTDCASEEHLKFLHDQMERYGWNLRREFKGPELLLEFEKPTRSCAYTIRPHVGYFGQPKGTDVIIYVEDNSIVY